jgi:arsenate reductase
VKVLFLCTANSCRSQMAEAWARHLFPADWEVHSGGLLTYRITKKTRAVMAEVGLDMAGQQTKTFDRFDLDSFDLIVTLSEEVGRYLPALADPARHVPCPMEDPMSATGEPEQVRAAFRLGRDRVKRVVEAVVAGDLRPGQPCPDFDG